MICGAEDLIAVCKEKVAAKAHQLSPDGKFSWEEVECLGACANAPMAQIGKDYYEDLTAEKLRRLIDRFSNGEVPVPGPQNGRYAAEPLSGLTSLTAFEPGRAQYNASAQRAVDKADTVRRIDGTEEPLLTPWVPKAEPVTLATGEPAEPMPGSRSVIDETGVTLQEAPEQSAGRPVAPGQASGGTATGEPGAPTAQGTTEKPATLTGPRDGKADNLQIIEGIGPKMEALCHSLGFYHIDQIAGWTPAEVAWVDANLPGFRGRVTRDRWVEQAKLIGELGEAEFLRRAKTNDY